MVALAFGGGAGFADGGAGFDGVCGFGDSGAGDLLTVALSLMAAVALIMVALALTVAVALLMAALGLALAAALALNIVFKLLLHNVKCIFRFLSFRRGSTTTPWQWPRNRWKMELR
jgi:hypothetical protein